MTTIEDEVIDYVEEQVEKVNPRAKKKKAKAANGDAKTEVVVLDPAKYDDRRAETGEARTEHHEQRILILPPPSEPMAVARIIVEGSCRKDGELILRYWRGSWWRWATTHWTEADDKIIRSVIYQFTEHAVFVSGDDVKPWAPTRRKVIDLLDALVAITVLHGEIDQPCWLDDCKIDAVVSVRNGLLDINQGRLLPHNPLFFNQTSVPFDYDEHALQPKRWLQFFSMSYGRMN